MPKIKIEKVLTFSSEDPHHPASNILNSDPARKWKCARTGEKMASIVLQLERAMQISGFDIGNENSAYIEVLVGRSSNGDEFHPLLGMSSFMSPLEARNHQNINKVRMLTSADFSKPECNEKWDLVKIVCIQPYNKHVQYGLSFVTIHTNEGATLMGKKNVGRFTLRPDSPTAFSVGSLFSKELDQLYQKPSTSLKGAAAIREASAKPSATSFKSPVGKCIPTIVPQPSTSKDDSQDADDSDKHKKRNRTHANLLYDDEDDIASEKIAKIDRLFERKKQENAEKEKLKKETKTPLKPSTTTETSAKKRKTDTLPAASSSESPKSPKRRRTSEVLKDLNASLATTPKPGPSKAKKRHSTDGHENASPKKIRRQNGGLRHATKLYENLLEGVVFVISGIQNPERAILRTSALAMGAKYKADWDHTCTHLICAFANTPKFNQVRGKGKIVKKEWIIECEKQRKRLPWRRFCLDRADNTGNESEEEIWEEVEASDSNEAEVTAASDTDDEVERIQRKQNQRQPKTTTNQQQMAPVEDRPSTSQDDLITDDETITDETTTNGGLPALPDYFSGMKFFLASCLGVLVKELRRYIIAYSGTIVETFENVDRTTIAITYGDDADNEELRAATDRLVSPMWLLECHNKKHLLPFDDYLL